jgi:hypothetical protein
LKAEGGGYVDAATEIRLGKSADPESWYDFRKFRLCVGLPTDFLAQAGEITVSIGHLRRTGAAELHETRFR